MKVIRIEEVWCSSCLIMKSRIQELLKEKNIEWISMNYEESEKVRKQYHINEDILPIYIREDTGSILVGETNKKEILNFFEEI